MELTIGLFSNISSSNVFVCHPKVLFAVMLGTYTARAEKGARFMPESGLKYTGARALGSRVA